jgi:pyruvate,water dikinase
MTTPDMIPALRKAGAVVTDEGGRTCHAAILSRELGIPCIVGARNATEVLAEGQNVVVDATRGVVFQGEERTAPSLVSAVSALPAASPRTAAQGQPAASPIPQSVTATKILINLEGPASVERCSVLPADGVGLLRTEFIFTGDIGIHPIYLVRTKQETLFVDKLAEGIAAVASGFSPRPVLMRFSDFRTNDLNPIPCSAGGERPGMSPPITNRASASNAAP